MDAVAAERFQSRHIFQGERHHASCRGFAEQIAGQGQSGGCLVVCGLGGKGARRELGRLGDPARIEDQHHGAIPAHRRTRIEPQRHEHSGDRLDDDLFADGNTVDHQPKLVVIDAQHHHRATGGRVGCQAECGVEIDQRQQPPAQPHHRAPIKPFHNRRRPAGVQGDQFPHVGLRDRKALLGTGDNQRRDDRQRERDPHPHCRADVGLAGDVDGAADRLDIGFDNIHADATARHIRHLRRGGESRFENELQHAVVRQQRRFLCADEPPGNRLATHRLHRNAPAVVPDFNRHLPALVKGPQLQPAGGRLPLGDSGGGRFDAVIDRVAQQMGERIADGFDQ